MLFRLAAFAFFLLPATAHAENAFYFGGFGNYSAAPYVGGGAFGPVVPSVGLRGEGFSIGTDGAIATISRSDTRALDAFVRPRFFDLIDSDNPALAGIERDPTLDAGLSYTVDLTTRTSLDVSVAQEITGEHDGQEADLRLTQRFAFGGLPLDVFAGATWRSEELSSYLYGVRPVESLPGRPAYGLGPTTTPYLGVNASVPLSTRAYFFGSVQAEFLSDEINASPIVDENTTLSLGIGVQFSF